MRIFFAENNRRTILLPVWRSLLLVWKHDVAEMDVTMTVVCGLVNPFTTCGIWGRPFIVRGLKSLRRSPIGSSTPWGGGAQLVWTCKVDTQGVESPDRKHWLAFGILILTLPLFRFWSWRQILWHSSEILVNNADWFPVLLALITCNKRRSCFQSYQCLK